MKIGITVGIGSGKSYICNIFSNIYGIPVMDSDTVVKTTIMYFESVMNQIIKTFGDDSYINGKINKDKFNKILFTNQDNLTLINNIIAPHLIRYFKNIAAYHKNIIIECPILLNTDVHNHVDINVLVTSDFDTRIKRLKLRYNNDIEMIMNKINAQSFDYDLIDYTLINNDTIQLQIKNMINYFNIQ